MVYDDLWLKYGSDHMLCMDCFERKLGRKINQNDLVDCPLNTWMNPYTKVLFNK